MIFFENHERQKKPYNTTYSFYVRISLFNDHDEATVRLPILLYSDEYLTERTIVVGWIILLSHELIIASIIRHNDVRIRPWALTLKLQTLHGILFHHRWNSLFKIKSI